MRCPSVRLLFATSVLLAACGGGDAPTDAAETSIRIVAGADVADSVEARSPQPLIVQVREGGQPKPGLAVRFESLPPTDTTRHNEQAITVSQLAQSSFTSSVTDTTDGLGRASVQVQFGTVAGAARIVVTCPELAVADTAEYTVRPGLPATLVMTPRDTVVRAGGSFTIGAASADRFANRRQDPVSFDSRSLLASVNDTGRVQLGLNIGRGYIRVRGGVTIDSVRFSVVPRMNPTFLHAATDGSTWIADVVTDGTIQRERVQTSSPAYPSPSPTSDLIAYQRVEGAASRIFVVDGSGATRELLAGAGFADARYPRFSPDGQFVYFAGLRNGTYAVWRVRADGSNLQQIVVTDGFTSPGVSPDGARIAYATQQVMMVFELATGKKTQIGQSGWFATFSPDGSRVAYLTGSALLAANTDGSAQFFFPMFPPISLQAGLSWVPGGNWLIVNDGESPMLVNVNTVEYLALPALSGWTQVAAEP